MFAYVATLLHDRAAAEDVTALAFERAYRKRRTFDAERGSERAWLFGIARNAALDELRRRKRTARTSTAEPATPTRAGPDDEAERALRRAALRAALAGARAARARADRAQVPRRARQRRARRRARRAAVSNAGTRLHRAVDEAAKGHR